MAAHLTPTETEPHPGTPPANHAYQAILDDLVHRGADIAQRLHGRIVAATEHVPDPHGPTPESATAADERAKTVVELSLAFDRVARAVRRTVTLALHLAADTLPAAAQSAATQRVAARKRILREVENAIALDTDGDTAARLGAELAERLDAPDLDDDILSRPVAEIVADLCRDLGLVARPAAPRGKRRTPAEVAALCARAAEPPQHPTPPDRPPPRPVIPLRPGPAPRLAARS